MLGAVVGACGGGGGEPMRVVIDGDGAFDDIKAIAYLLERPDVEILAITVSGTGIARCPIAAENIAAMLLRVGAPDIPVACGRTTPLEGTNQAPEAWRNAADTLGGVDLPDPPDVSATSASELLAEALADEDDVVLVAIGPLTNIAEALDRDPALADHIAMMYLMGGAVDAGGNVLYANPDAEFNIWADPHAASIVFATDIPITMVPLDATNAVPVTPHLYEAIAAHRNASPIAEFMAEFLDVSPLHGGMYHWDELAAVAATEEAVVTIENRRLEVIENGGPSAGATVVSEGGRPVRVAVDASPEMFEDVFYAAILGTSETGIPSWRPDATLSWDGSTCAYDGPDPLPASMWIRLDNESSDTIAWLTGSYAPGTTSEDWDAYLMSGETDPPEWWTELGQIVVPAGAHDVWEVTARPGVTAICYVDETRLWEVTGPRISR